MKVRDIVLIALLSASLTAGKLLLSFIPNVEIVTLLLLVFTSVFGFKRSLLISLIFVTTEILLYGFSTWVLGYYVVWPALVIVASLLGKVIKAEYGYAIVGGIFGLTFGLMFAVVESFFYGVAYGLAYWVKGIPFDLIHGASNFVVIILLFKPISKALSKQATHFKHG
jgi:energy-coupling factor transport system substrate-specific component